MLWTLLIFYIAVTVLYYVRDTSGLSMGWRIGVSLLWPLDFILISWYFLRQIGR